jgi:hypothetical protein
LLFVTQYAHPRKGEKMGMSGEDFRRIRMRYGMSAREMVTIWAEKYGYKRSLSGIYQSEQFSDEMNERDIDHLIAIITKPTVIRIASDLGIDVSWLSEPRKRREADNG